MQALAFFAHPDDETMLAGGTLALLTNNGVVVHYLCATRGEGGELGEPPICTVDQLGFTREQEMGCAVNVLNGQSLTFFDYVDPRVGPGEELFAFTCDIDTLADRVAEHIHNHGVSILITHGSDGEYGHPAHVNCFQAAYQAVNQLLRKSIYLYTVSAAFPQHPYPRITNASDPAHMVVDVVPVLNQKTAAALCHATQHALFVRRRSKIAGHQLTVPEVILKVEGIHRHLPVWRQGEEDPLMALLAQHLIQF